MNAPLVEVRLPTYRRPLLLERALKCLQAQTHQNWTAVVFDDSPDREGSQVVEKMRDTRILYRANAKNLGAAENIDQCFEATAYAGGAYFGVLEDDNLFLPNFMSDNIKRLTETGCKVMLRNQLREYPTERDGDGEISKTGIQERVFRGGVYSAEEFHLSVFTLFIAAGSLRRCSASSPKSSSLRIACKRPSRWSSGN